MHVVTPRACRSDRRRAVARPILRERAVVRRPEPAATGMVHRSGSRWHRPHRGKIEGPVQVGANAPNRVALPNAPLDWTVAPTITVGYRLPSGFGEFALSYRGFATQGTVTFGTPTAPPLNSRLDLNRSGVPESNICCTEPDDPARRPARHHRLLRLNRRGVPGRSSSRQRCVPTTRFQQLLGHRPERRHRTVTPHQRDRSVALASVDATDLLGRLSQNFTETATATNAAASFSRVTPARTARSLCRC